jgi:hypothetical protein
VADIVVAVKPLVKLVGPVIVPPVNAEFPPTINDAENQVPEPFAVPCNILTLPVDA